MIEDGNYPRYGTKRFAKLLGELRLAPCPFCGDKNIFIKMEVTGTPSEMSYMAWAYCYECDAIGPTSGGVGGNVPAWEIAVDAGQSWSKRAPSA